MMKRLLRYGNRFVEQSDWKDIALIKICLFSLGLLAGSHVAKKHKKRLSVCALGAFVVTYVVLMAKFLRVIREN